MTYLYDQIAGDLAGAIERGVFPPGARLPSIRSTQKHYGVSVATVMEAFARLEVKGLIDVRPKSGHFVKVRNDVGKLPKTRRPSPRPGRVSVVDLAMEVLSVTSQPAAIPLGAAVPGPATLPLEAMARIHARAARIGRRRMGSYEDPKGAIALRRAVSRLMTDSGVVVDPARVVITNGAQEALNLSLRAVTKAGEVVAVESPTYFGVLQAIEAIGLRVLELPTHPSTGVDIGALEKVAKESRINACVLSPTCQNPLGFNMSAGHKRAAVDILNRYRIPLIEDDVFGTLGLDDPRPAAAKSFDTGDNVMLCSSFSKTVSPGLRLGWVAPGKHMENVLRQKFLANLSTCVVSQHAMADFLDGNRFRKITRCAANTYARRLQSMRDAVFRYFPEGTRCTAPQGGFFLWVELPRGHDTMVLFKYAAQRGISFSPGKMFSRGNTHRNCMRLSCARTDEDGIDEAIGKLARLIPRARERP